MSINPADPSTWYAPAHWGPEADGTWTFAQFRRIAHSINSLGDEYECQLDVSSRNTIHLNVARDRVRIARVFVNRGRFGAAILSVYGGDDESLDTKYLRIARSAIESWQTPVPPYEEWTVTLPPDLEYLESTVNWLPYAGGGPKDFAILRATLSRDEEARLVDAYREIVDREHKERIDQWFEETDDDRSSSRLFQFICVLDQLADAGVIPEPYSHVRFIEWSTSPYDDAGNEW